MELAQRCDAKFDPDVKAAADVLLNVNLLCSRQAHGNIAALTPYEMRRREEARSTRLRLVVGSVSNGVGSVFLFN